MIIDVKTSDKMLEFGARFGQILRSGDLVELVGDVGAGKTTLVKGIARGIGVTDDVQSPTYTLTNTYQAANGLEILHYDFYRLSDPGIMAAELAEVANSKQGIAIIEWAEIVAGVLPEDRITVKIQALNESSRQIEITGLDASRNESLSV